MDESKKNPRFDNEPLILIIVTILIFALAILALKLPFFKSLLLIVLCVAVMLVAERRGLMGRLFLLYIRHRKLACLISALGVLSMPIILATDRYVAHIAVMAVIYAMVCLGLNFQMGSTNMVNFAPAAFMGIGAYSLAVITGKMGMSPWFGMLTALVFCIIAGLLIGLPTLRTKGYYLSLVTMALQLAFTQLIKNIPYLGGPNGISGVKTFDLFGLPLYKSYTVFGIKLAPQAPYLLFCLIILMLLIYVAMRIYLSRFGLALNAIAQDEVAADCLGIDVTRHKLFAFVIGSVFCGIGGALYAGLSGFVGPTDFTFARSLVFICMVILGGMDSVMGVVLGAFLLTVITEKLRDFSDYAQLVYALILIVMLIARPCGLLPKRVRNYCLLFNRDLKEVDRHASCSD
ncbi:MAG: branched-chain amino acid ABC transporter permease [Clostridia bacterium]|nr:branched-chain amino acid ABC transporter permease [Clostridia bacterium]